MIFLEFKLVLYSPKKKKKKKKEVSWLIWAMHSCNTLRCPFSHQNNIYFRKFTFSFRTNRIEVICFQIMHIYVDFSWKTECLKCKRKWNLQNQLQFKNLEVFSGWYYCERDSKINRFFRIIFQLMCVFLCFCKFLSFRLTLQVAVHF